MSGKSTMAISIGALLLLVNIGMAVTGFVDGQIESGVQTQVAEGYDGLDEDGNQDWSIDYDEDWHVSTSERVYYAYNLDAETALASDEICGASCFEKMGPFIYEVTTTREILDFDYNASTMTYSEYDVFEWCENCTHNGKTSMSEHTNITQVNILWNTQRIGGMGAGIEYGEIFAKGMFAAQMIEYDLSYRAPSTWASEDIAEMVDVFEASLEAMGMDGLNASILAPSGVLSGVYTGADGTVEDILNNTEIFFDYSDGILYDAEDESTETCIALTCDLGPWVAAGMGAPDGGQVTQDRADLYGYGDADAAEIDAIDWTVYGLAASKLQEHGGGDEINNETSQLRERFLEVSGVNILNPDTLNNLLFDPNVGLMGSFEISGIELPGMVVGLLLPLQSADYFGAMESYNVGLLSVVGIAEYAEPWVGLGILGERTKFELILAGGEGTMASNDWWLSSFGDYDPLGGTYIEIGLNRGDFAGMASLTAEKSDFILNDPEIGLKSSFPSQFMYGELSGMSLPDENGQQVIWDDAYVAGLYGISDEAAQALRDWVRNFYFDTVMPVLLTFVTGNEASVTMSINNWLYGWNDAVNTYFGYFPWVSLETNDTYYGSGGVSTGDRSVYQVSTSGDNVGQQLMQGYINSDGDGMCDYDYDSDGAFLGYDLECAENQTYGMTEHLPWRAPHREDSALGLLSDHVGNPETVLSGTVGSIADADASFDVNLIGYTIAHSEVGNTVTYKGIEMVEHKVIADPAETQIQGKLIGSATYVDAMPGALPVYLGADIDMKVEPLSNALMYGDVEVTFYLDLRGVGMMNPDFDSGDVHPVFVINTFSEIEDDQASDFRAAVSDNLGPTGWTNFGGSVGGTLAIISYAQAAFYFLGIGLIGFGMINREDED